MRFDEEGHVLISPREIHEGVLGEPGVLINRALLPGTPLAIPTHEQHCRLLDYFATQLGVHPRNFFFKGSTKIGYSIAPKPDKLWIRYGPASDLDLAIVDSHFFQLIDGQVRQWERHPDNRRRMFQNPRLSKALGSRVRQKGQFECFRHFDLPPVPLLVELNRCLESSPILECCGIARPISAFLFRDWWGVYQRYDHDLHQLWRGLNDHRDPLPSGQDDPRPFAESL